MDLQGEAVEEPETTPEREAASRPPLQLQVGHLYLKLIVPLQGSIRLSSPGFFYIIGRRKN